MAHARSLPVDHPGTFILEEMEERGWDQVDLAYILGISPQQLSPLLTGKANVTPNFAAQLGEAFDVPAEFFANLQKLYDLYKANPVDPGVRTRARWVSNFPVREMIKRGWLEDTDAELLDLQMMRFFGKNRIEDILFVGDEAQPIPHAAKKSSEYESLTPIQYAWLHRVIKVAEAASAPLYSESLLRQSLPKIRAHLLDKEDLARIPEILQQCGVRFVIVEALPGSKIDGVCVWLGGQPAIGMTIRLDRLDNFAFVLRHEIEHVLMEDGRERSHAAVDEIGEDCMSADLPPEEIHANKQASEFCIPQAMLEGFLLRKGNFISEQDVLAFAARLEIHPAIVIGQIQRRMSKYNWLRKYQSRIRGYLSSWPYTDGWDHQFPTGL